MFENCDFIRKINDNGFEAVVQDTADKEKKIVFTLAENNDVFRTEVIERKTGVFKNKRQNDYKFSFACEIPFEQVDKAIVVLTWEVRNAVLEFTCFLGGKIEVIDLNRLYALIFHHLFRPYGGISFKFFTAGRVIEISSLRGTHLFDLNLYEHSRAEKLYTFDKSLQAKYALLGLGEILFSDKGDLISLIAGRKGILQIPNNCKVIKTDSINQSGAHILKVGREVKECEDFPFCAMEIYGVKLDLEFDGTSAEVVGKIFLEYFFHSKVGYSAVQETVIKVKSGLSEVLTGLILAASDERFYISCLTYANVKDFSRYFVSSSEFNICEDITREEAVQVLDSIAEYIEGNIGESLEFSDKNIVNYATFGGVVLEFKASMRNLLTKEENQFYDKAFGVIYKFSTSEAYERLEVLLKQY